MEFRHPFQEEHLRTVEMCTPPERLGLRSFSDLNSSSMDQIAAAFQVAVTLYDPDSFRSSDSPQMANNRGCETYMAYCLHLLRENRAASELKACLESLRRFPDGIAILGLVYSVTGENVDDLLSEAESKLKSEVVHDGLPHFANARLMRALKDILSL